MASCKRLILALLLAGWAALAAAQGGIAVPKPGPRDTCPVCGMLVSKYPNWAATVLYKDGHAHYFDGAKDMFKYLADLPKYAPGHKRGDIKSIVVTEYYGLSKIDATQAFYVVGSDVLGPMGHELVPLQSKADAEDFFKEHKGKRVLRFDEVKGGVLENLDEGK